MAVFLRISLFTFDVWSKIGILNPIRMDNKIFFKKQDILNTLENQTINKKRMKI